MFDLLPTFAELLLLLYRFVRSEQRGRPDLRAEEPDSLVPCEELEHVRKDR